MLYRVGIPVLARVKCQNPYSIQLPPYTQRKLYPRMHMLYSLYMFTLYNICNTPKGSWTYI